MLELSQVEKEELAAKRTDHRRLEWTACRALLQKMTGQPAHIFHDANRKPHLQNDNRAISLSHSGDLACVYLGSVKNVGVDIQKMKPNIAKGFDYFLHKTEQHWANLDDNLVLHLIWSAKEAVFKYAGDPDLDLKKHIVTNPFEGNQKGLIEVSILKAASENVRVAFENFDDYVLTWTC